MKDSTMIWVSFGLVVLAVIILWIIETKPWRKSEGDESSKPQKEIKVRSISSSGILLSVLLIILIICEGFNSYQISKLNKIQEEIMDCKSAIDDIQYNDPSGAIKDLQGQISDLQSDMDDVKSKVTDIEWNTSIR